ncbi:MAG TPA: TetR family transcriptional regulator [Leifsonia sp.]|jgi:AcrR family transcriptional regulator|nr:TetR family transcriptional regulator [Leifsonia sp.]
MVRWEPGSGERLRRAAIELFLEYGYESVTVAQIADRAGLTRRTFSRYFADKRDVLFAGSDQLPSALAEAVGRVDPEVPPFEAMLQALADVAGVLGEWVAEHAAQRREIIASSPELQERGQAKFAAVADALAAALRERGADRSTSALLADVGVAVFRSGFDRWVDAPHELDLASRIRRAGNQLKYAAAQKGSI